MAHDAEMKRFCRPADLTDFPRERRYICLNFNKSSRADASVTRKSVKPEARNKWVPTLISEGKYFLAEIAARRSVPLASARTGPVSENYASALAAHAQTINHTGDYSTAESIYREALAIGEKTIGVEHPDYANRLGNLAMVLAQKGDVSETREMLNQALSIFKSALPEDHPNIAEILRHIDSFK